MTKKPAEIVSSAMAKLGWVRDESKVRAAHPSTRPIPPRLPATPAPFEPKDWGMVYLRRASFTEDRSCFGDLRQPAPGVYEWERSESSPWAYKQLPGGVVSPDTEFFPVEVVSTEAPGRR